jgi:MFS family permease
MPALALLCVAQFVLVLDVNIVGVALPAIRDDLGFSAAGLQWVVSAYVLAFGGLLLLAGRLGDAHGRRRLFTAGLAVFGLGSLACGLAPAAEALVAARALQGTGAALVTPASLALVTTLFPRGAARTKALATWTAAAPVGGAAGLLLGGVLVAGPGWPAIFLVNVPLAIAGLALVPRLLPADPPRTRRALDALGAATGTLAVAALVLACSRAQQASPADPVAVAGLAAALGLGAAFALTERRARDPLLAPGTLAQRPLAVASITALALTATSTPPLFFITLHLQGRLGWSPAATGLSFLPVLAAITAASVAAPSVVRATSVRTTAAAGLAAIAAGTLLVAAALPDDGGYLTAILPGGLLYGAGLGLGSVASTSAGTAALDPARQGLASGVLNTAAQIGTALGLALLVAVSTAADGVDGTRAAFLADAVLAAVAAVAVGSRPWRHPHAAPSPPGSRASARRSSPR